LLGDSSQEEGRHVRTQEDDGASGYTCRDPEGHVWSFGDHDPWL